MKASEIKNISFSKGAFGYRTEDVHAYLEEVAEFVAELQKKYDILLRESEELKKENQHMHTEEDSIKDIIVNAQKFSTSITEDAKKKAAQLMADAEKKANKFLKDAKEKSDNLVNDASDKSHRMISEATEKANRLEKESVANADKMGKESKKMADIEERRLKAMQKEVSAFKANLLNIYKAHLDLITKLPEIEETEAEEPKNALKEEKTQKKKKADTENEFATKQIITEDQNLQSGSLRKESKPAAKRTPFKITVTENPKDKKEEKIDAKQIAEEQEKDAMFHSRFGELKFGTHMNIDLSKYNEK